METVQKYLNATLSVLDDYDVSLKKLLDCREIRENFLQIEISTCFSFNR